MPTDTPTAAKLIDGEFPWDERTTIVRARALRALVAELESLGLRTRLDSCVAAVDAMTYSIGARGRSQRVVQRAILRPHNQELWWWLLWPSERFAGEVAPPSITPLMPAADSVDTARRVYRVMVLNAD